MTLISILFALIAERLGARSARWQIATYAHWYERKSAPLLSRLQQLHNGIGLLLWLLVPTLVIAVFVHASDFILWQLAVNTLVILICFGCAHMRANYKGYLNALTRDDGEAATLYALQMGQKRTENESGGETFAQTLAWVNFRFYCAVIFWFVVLGAPGAVFYALVRTCVDDSEQTSHPLSKQHTLLARVGHWLEWPAARIASLGYLVIGNFSKGTQCWLRHVLDFRVSNRQVITETALAAEQIELVHYGCTIEAQCMIRLVKRNVLFFLALIALLTLFGGLS
ncbi:beta-lactamase regulator AmpE [Pseudoalteromonas ruthenica]|uniref:Regulatory protein n=1 Tax=Pseudoalteromonas ruthenica TaxID=151081 RepID=A0A0F4Q2G0_9GAMM|nr:beta-lactamase regulator AmpE [Pseudoalteromonas ruthenica]KJY97879.1 regulatory protein [Pseudoalteromonas ruthenica]KJZ01906.1 regulatory protein [Pseudoalteromonas ruthenica]TMO89275.1 regulatory signaling modulator protein AmpE [Pseudoalteromonas ruthenica]TMO94691.1 regulatory signaling modulator protein AmpE [Pseudoalteromonas ruthenica]TMO99924.1 regulatory signaling modulator protein AmpE [Pseudoalteromonas ruthenica]